MYDYNKPFGESCYRLMSRTGSFIYLKTRGYLEIDKDTNKVHSFVCINTLVSEEEGKRMVSEMKRKFSIIIDPEATIPESGDANSEEHMSVENPLQIERAIMNLITNLESSGSSVVAPSSSGSNCTGTPPPTQGRRGGEAGDRGGARGRRQLGRPLHAQSATGDHCAEAQHDQAVGHQDDGGDHGQATAGADERRFGRLG